MLTLRSMRAAAPRQWAAWLLFAAALFSLSPHAVRAQTETPERQ